LCESSANELHHAVRISHSAYIIKKIVDDVVSPSQYDIGAAFAGHATFVAGAIADGGINVEIVWLSWVVLFQAKRFWYKRRCSLTACSCSDKTSLEVSPELVSRQVKSKILAMAVVGIEDLLRCLLEQTLSVESRFYLVLTLSLFLPSISAAFGVHSDQLADFSDSDQSPSCSLGCSSHIIGAH